jgi:hypothetical protein
VGSQSALAWIGPGQDGTPDHGTHGLRPDVSHGLGAARGVHRRARVRQGIPAVTRRRRVPSAAFGWPSGPGRRQFPPGFAWSARLVPQGQSLTREVATWQSGSRRATAVLGAEDPISRCACYRSPRSALF